MMVAPAALSSSFEGTSAAVPFEPVATKIGARLSAGGNSGACETGTVWFEFGDVETACSVDCWITALPFLACCTLPLLYIEYHLFFMSLSVRSSRSFAIHDHLQKRSKHVRRQIWSSRRRTI